MRTRWQTKKLGDICEFVRGPFGGSLKKSIFTADGYAVYEQQHAIYDQFDDVRYFIDKQKFEEMKRFELHSGDLIMSCSGTMGRVAIVPLNIKTGIINQALLKLTPTASVLASFLKYWMESEAFQDSLKEYSGGAAIQNVASVKVLKEIAIPLPPIKEQKRIVAILDEAFEGIDTAVANTERNLANARALFDSYLNSVFVQRRNGWITEPLGKIVKFIDYRGNTPPKRDAGIRLITAKNVKMGYVQRSPEEFVDPAAYDGWMTRGFPQKGDVLFTTEAPLGNVAQLDTDETVIIGQRLITFQPHGRPLDRTFLKFALMSGPIQQEIRKRATGATVVGIKASLLKQVPIHFPNILSEQSETAGKIGEMSEACQRLGLIHKQKLDALIELKQAILHKAFAGELTAHPEKALPEAAE